MLKNWLGIKFLFTLFRGKARYEAVFWDHSKILIDCSLEKSSTPFQTGHEYKKQTGGLTASESDCHR